MSYLMRDNSGKDLWRFGKFNQSAHYVDIPVEGGKGTLIWYLIMFVFVIFIYAIIFAIFGSQLLSGEFDT